MVFLSPFFDQEAKAPPYAQRATEHKHLAKAVNGVEGCRLYSARRTNSAADSASGKSAMSMVAAVIAP